MSSITAGRAAARDREERGRSWFAALGVNGRRAFRAAYAGYMLDAFLTLPASAVGGIRAPAVLLGTQGREFK